MGCRVALGDGARANDVTSLAGRAWHVERYHMGSADRFDGVVVGEGIGDRQLVLSPLRSLMERSQKGES